MKVAIVGSRDFFNLELVRAYIDKLDPDEDVIVSGGARGVDREAIWHGLERGHRTIEMKANWTRYGKSAGIRRNIELVNFVDRVVCFWDGKSRGSKHVIDYCEKIGKPIETVRE